MLSIGLHTKSTTQSYVDLLQVIAYLAESYKSHDFSFSQLELC